MNFVRVPLREAEGDVLINLDNVTYCVNRNVGMEIYFSGDDEPVQVGLSMEELVGVIRLVDQGEEV